MKLSVVCVGILLATATAGAVELKRSCYQEGEPCANAKRSALALAEAVAEPNAGLGSSANPLLSCYQADGICSKAKREALAADEALAEFEGLDARDRK